MSKSNVIAELDDLLEKERKALFQGELEKLAGLIERKQELIEALNEFGLSGPEELSALKGKAARNQALLDGALRGIKSVATRLATLQKVRRSLETYDERGRKKTIQGMQKRTLEKRA